MATSSPVVVVRAARDAGVARLVHVSTVGVYDRSADFGDVAEDGALLPEGSGDDAVTKNATDAALAQVGGLTTVLVRPPAILGAGTRRSATRCDPRRTFGGERRAGPGGIDDGAGSPRASGDRDDPDR